MEAHWRTRSKDIEIRCTTGLLASFFIAIAHLMPLDQICYCQGHFFYLHCYASQSSSYAEADNSLYLYELLCNYYLLDFQQPYDRYIGLTMAVYFYVTTFSFVPQVLQTVLWTCTLY